MKGLYFAQHGGPEVMQYGDLPDRQPGPGEALMRVRAVALNHLDLWVRRGGPAFEKLPKPHVGGTDVAGIVAGYGDGATGPAIGARVVVDPGVVTGETNGRDAAKKASARITTSWAKTSGAAARNTSRFRRAICCPSRMGSTLRRRQLRRSCS